MVEEDRMNTEQPKGLGIELDPLDLPDLEDMESVPGAQEERPGDRVDDLLSGILENLDKEMKAGKFLHTFTAQIAEINRIIKTDYASSRDIAQVILKDVSVASKVLSLVNSAFYAHFGKDGVASISEAMVILGTEAVQQTAATVLLFEFMRDIAKSDLLQDKSLSSLMRGIMGRQIAESLHGEEKDAFQLIAMLHDIGEQVLIFCKPEVYQRIATYAQAEKLDQDLVAKKMLGVSFSEVGRGIAMGWGFPEAIVEGLYPFQGFDGKERKLSLKHLKRLVASFTYEMCNMERPMDAVFRKNRIEEILQKYSRFLSISPEEAETLLDHALTQMERHARILKIQLKDTRFDRTSGRSAGVRSLQQPSLICSSRSEDKTQGLEVQSSWLEERIRAIEKILMSDFRLSDVLLEIITAIYKGFFFSRIAICILNKADNLMIPRFVLGDDIQNFKKEFQFPVDDYGGDIFNKAMNTGLDIVIEDVENRDWNSRVPEWYQRGNFSEAFALYPILVQKKKIGLIYVDWSQECTPLFSNDVKVLMQKLKTLTLLAIKRSRM